MMRNKYIDQITVYKIIKVKYSLLDYDIFKIVDLLGISFLF